MLGLRHFSGLLRDARLGDVLLKPQNTSSIIRAPGPMQGVLHQLLWVLAWCET